MCSVTPLETVSTALDSTITLPAVLTMPIPERTQLSDSIQSPSIGGEQVLIVGTLTMS